jgi:hypothetical protein
MDLKIPLIRDVWPHDISSFGYKETFRDLVFRPAAGIEPATPPDTRPE